MLYHFSPIIQAGIAAGKYIPVVSSSGVPLSMVRDAATGRFVAHAIGLTTQGLNPVNPITGLVDAYQIYQGQKIIQSLTSLSASVTTLQATTAVIGLGVAATAVLGAVNLWQTLKLRQDIKELRVEVKEGFIDLKRVLADQGEEIIRHIQQVSEDVQFNAHRTILVRAYGLFDKALNRLGSAITIQDQSIRFDEITAARDMLFKALADYSNDQILSDISFVVYLRRRECIWAIEQAIAMTYQLQGEFATVNSRLIELDGTIRNDVIKVVDLVKEKAELDFLYPEIIRIYDHDLAAVNAWKAHAEWYQNASLEEIQSLEELNIKANETDDNVSFMEESIENIPLEYQFYEEAQKQSYYVALRDSLLLLVSPDQRSNVEQYISEQAELAGLQTLNQENLSQASPLALANLWNYFYTYDDSIEEDREEVLEEVAS